MASWNSGSGRVTDAFKTGQEPGGTESTIGGGQVTEGMTVSTSGPGLGVDSGMGGLY